MMPPGLGAARISRSWRSGARAAAAAALLHTALSVRTLASDPGKVKADLHKILTQPEFRQDNGSSVIEKALAWLGSHITALLHFLNRLLNKLLSPLGRVPGVGSSAFGIQYILLGIIIIVMAFLVAKLVKEASKNRTKRPPKKKKIAVIDIDDAPADAVAAPDVWLDQADRYARSGDYRRAFRAVYLALLLRLDRAGAIAYHRARTNGDYVRTLRNREPLELLGHFEPVSYNFDTYWYGGVAPAEDDYMAARTTYQRIGAILSTPQESGAHSASRR